MKKDSNTYENLCKMGRQYGVENNALFLRAIDQYAKQQRVIDLLTSAIDGNELPTQKTYLAGEKNDYAAPLVKELPKHSDAANRTAQIILDIVTKLGHKSDEDEDGGFNCE